LPPGSSDRSYRILTGLLAGRVQAWVSYQRSESKVIVDGVVLTKVEEDEIFGVRDLNVFCVWAIRGTRKSTWTEGIEALLAFGRGKNCNRLVALTNVPSIRDFIKNCGGEAKYTFLTLPIQ